ncbi:hypothetical protein Tco_1256016 [Tanacetum coccineum]
MEQMTSICDMVGQYMQKKEEEKRIAEEQATKNRYWKIPICYDDDDDEESSIPLKDIIISGLPPCVAITPVLSTKELRTLSQSQGFSDSNDDSTSIDDDSFSIDNIDYVEASPPDSELVSLEEIEAINYNPPPSSNFVTKSSSTFLNFFLEETNTFDNSLTESETFCFDLEENSSGSTTTRSDYSLPDYEAFYLDDYHIEEKSSGSTTTHSDISLSKYDSFIFDLLTE